jgi:hypothetical protein
VVPFPPEISDACLSCPTDGLGCNEENFAQITVENQPQSVDKR